MQIIAASDITKKMVAGFENAQDFDTDNTPKTSFFKSLFLTIVPTQFFYVHSRMHENIKP